MAFWNRMAAALARAALTTSSAFGQDAIVLALADGFRDAGDPIRAAEAYARALQVTPSRNDVRLQLANMLKDSGRLQEAEETYDAVIRRDPDNADAHLQRGHVYKLQGRRAAAQAAYRMSIALDSLSVAGRELAAMGDPASQERMFEVQMRSVAVEPLLSLGRQIADLRRALDALADSMPDYQAGCAFPLAVYDEFRRLCQTPTPPAHDPTTFTVLMFADHGSLDLLYRQLRSVRAQTCSDWVLIAIGADEARAAIIQAAGVSDTRVRWFARPPEDSEAQAEARVALLAETDNLVLLDLGDSLDRQALAWFAAVLAVTPAYAVLADEEIVIEQGGTMRRSDPKLGQTVDYDTMLDADIYGGTMAVATVAYRRWLYSMKRDGGKVPQAAPDWLHGKDVAWSRRLLRLDLARRSEIGHLPLMLASKPGQPNPEHETRLHAIHRDAVAAHLVAAELDGRVDHTDEDVGLVTWRPREPDTPMAVIIPTRDHGDDVTTMVESLIATAARPDALRIVLVDNGSRKPTTLAALQRLAAIETLTCLTVDEPFNWSRLNNTAAAAVETPYLVFANDDMRMVTREWDVRLRGLLERHDVGAAGAKLLYPDNTLQHAGILFDWGSSLTIHDGLFEPATALGPGRRWTVTRAVSAVTGAFLATRRRDFMDIAGFDEIELPVAFSDIDYALKLRSRGLKILWTPAIELYHMESKSRGLDHLQPEKFARNRAERDCMIRRWGSALTSEPNANPSWLSATLPFHLLSPPSQAQLNRYIRRAASTNPWQVDRTERK